MKNNIELLSINNLLGNHFYIPYYQRGYRWTEHNVEDLLDDIFVFTKNTEKFYCLQPVVVKNKTWLENNTEIQGFEVVDGQQRLTTIFIILTYLMKEFLMVDSLKNEYQREIYTLRYETRTKSEEFLKNIQKDYSNIDYYHISKAYQTVKNWFENPEKIQGRGDKNRFLDALLGRKDEPKSVQIIWYIVQEKADSVELFNRLNMGKIPLTNAELIKAIFLSSSSFSDFSEEEATRKKIVISQLWDIMEHQLNDDNFWSFITNSKKEKYATKIELLFDIIAKKSYNEIDPLFTFLHFMMEAEKANGALWDIWLTIERYYFTLLEWFKDKKLYHKTGYLISVGINLKDLVEISVTKNKIEFDYELDKRIKATVSADFENLSYDNSNDYKKIERILTLFNIESIRTNEMISEFYPFKLHKKQHWSLEHIHAQNSESLDKNKKEPWLIWLKLHKNLIVDLEGENTDSNKSIVYKNLKAEIDESANEGITWDIFEKLSAKIIDIFSEKGDEMNNAPHNISNLALLGMNENSALNNSVFEVKRRAIIKMDMNGSYIPVCTKRVFLKYYNNKNGTQQSFFWGHDDRNAYIEEIKRVLEPYLN